MADKSSKNQSPSEEKALKEKLLDEKMRLIRQRNEERLRRQREIEEDIKNANTHESEVKGNEDTPVTRTMGGVTKHESVSKFRGRARGRALEKMSKEKLQAKKFKEQQKTNYELVEKEIKEEKTSTGFLFDDRRVDMSKAGSRSTHSWGGSQFEDVVDRVNTISKEQTRRSTKRNQNIEINMTGKERLKYQEWKEERQHVDQARQSRQKKGDTWKREWDWDKGQHSSFGGRNDHEDQTRSGQRFGQRTGRRKPEWNYHDDRGDDDFQEVSSSFSNNKADNDDSMNNVASSEDWGDVDQPSGNVVPNSTPQKGGFDKPSANSFQDTTGQTEDWDDADTTAAATKIPTTTASKREGKVLKNLNRSTTPFKECKQNWDVKNSNRVKPNTENPQKGFGQTNNNATRNIASEEDWEEDVDTTVTFTALQLTMNDHGFPSEVRGIKNRLSTSNCPQNDRENDREESLSVSVDSNGERTVKGYVDTEQSSSMISSEVHDESSKTAVNNTQEHEGNVHIDDNRNSSNQILSETMVNTAGQEINTTKEDCCKKDTVADKSNKDNEAITDTAVKTVPEFGCHGEDGDATKADENKSCVEEIADVTANDDTKKTQDDSCEDKLETDETSLPSKESDTAQRDGTSTQEKEIIQDVIKETKTKDNLPKLDIKKMDNSEEPVPDFLKTPQYKNWADYDFDEEELNNLSQDMIFYQT